MKYTFILLLFTTTIAFSQKGFNKKSKTLDANTSSPQGQFEEIQGGKADKNSRQLTTQGLTTKFISKLKVTKDAESGRILMIENLSKSSGRARMSTQMLASSFLSEVKTTLRIQDPAQELEMLNMETDEIGMTHIQMQQKYKNIPVYGGEIWLHSKGDKIETLMEETFLLLSCLQ